MKLKILLFILDDFMGYCKAQELQKRVQRLPQATQSYYTFPYINLNNFKMLESE